MDGRFRNLVEALHAKYEDLSVQDPVEVVPGRSCAAERPGRLFLGPGEGGVVKERGEWKAKASIRLAPVR